MIIDYFFNFLYNFMLWVVNLMPNTPDWAQPKGSFALMMAFLNTSFIPMGDLVAAFTIALGFWAAIRGFAVIRFVVNLIRGAGA